MAPNFKILPNYSYADYCQWEGRWEIIDGIPFAMNTEFEVRHQEITTKLLGIKILEMMRFVLKSMVMIGYPIQMFLQE
jgi:hypothetical protein